MAEGGLAFGLPTLRRSFSPTPLFTSIPVCLSHPSARPLLQGALRERETGWVLGCRGTNSLLPLSPAPSLAWLPIPLASFPSASAANPACSRSPPAPSALVFRFSADGRPCCRVGRGPQLGLLLAPLALQLAQALGYSSTGAPGTPEGSCCPSACPRWRPIRLRLGDLPCLASPELALLLSPALSRSSTFPRGFPPCQVPAPPARPPRPPRGPPLDQEPSRPGYVRRMGASPAGARPRAELPRPLKAPPILGQTFAGFSGLPGWVQLFGLGDSKIIGPGESGLANSPCWAGVCCFPSCVAGT